MRGGFAFGKQKFTQSTQKFKRPTVVDVSVTKESGIKDSSFKERHGTVEQVSQVFLNPLPGTKR